MGIINKWLAQTNQQEERDNGSNNILSLPFSPVEFKRAIWLKNRTNSFASRVLTNILSKKKGGGV